MLKKKESVCSGFLGTITSTSAVMAKFFSNWAPIEPEMVFCWYTLAPNLSGLLKFMCFVFSDVCEFLSSKYCVALSTYKFSLTSSSSTPKHLIRFLYDLYVPFDFRMKSMLAYILLYIRFFSSSRSLSYITPFSSRSEKKFKTVLFMRISGATIPWFSRSCLENGSGLSVV